MRYFAWDGIDPSLHSWIVVQKAFHVLPTFLAVRPQLSLEHKHLPFPILFHDRRYPSGGNEKHLWRISPFAMLKVDERIPKGWTKSTNSAGANVPFPQLVAITVRSM